MTAPNIFTVFDLKTGKPAKGNYILENEDMIQYIEDGLRHRDDGPAIIYHAGDHEGDIEWWWHGRAYFFDDWCNASKASEELITLLKLQYVEKLKYNWTKTKNWKDKQCQKK